MLRIFLAALLAFSVSAPSMVFAQASLGITPCKLGSGGQTVTSMTPTTSSSSVQFGTCGSTLIIYNTTSQEVFYNIAPATGPAANPTLTATTSGHSIPGGYYVILNIGQQGLYFAAIVATDTTILRFVQGRAST